MADWVHCNLCFRQPGDGHKFSLTNCGHIYCDQCLAAGTREKCQICGKVPCTTMTLSAKMKPDVEIYFTDPMEIVKKQQKQLLRVMDFQKNHRQRWTAHNRERRSREASTMQTAQKAVGQLRGMEREMMVLREENAYLKKLVSGSRGGSSQNSRMSHQAGYSNLSPIPHRMKGSGVSPTSGVMPKQKPQQFHDNHSGFSSSQVTPTRLLVRTPPSHGRMGTIPYTASPNCLPLTPGPMEANTPGGSCAKTGGRSMGFSPAYGSRKMPSNAMSFTPTSSSMANYSPLIHASPSPKDGRKAIQLHYSQNPSFTT